MTDDFSNLSLDEQLSAYLDGEVSEAERALIEQKLASDPDAAKRLEQLRGADHAYTGGTEINTAPMSEGLAALATRLNAEPGSAAGETVVPLRTARSWFQTLREHRAIAACAAMVSGFLAMQASVGSLQMASTDLPGDGIVVASSELFNVFQRGASGDPQSIGDGQTATPQFTFASDNGAPCRVVDVTSDTRSGRMVGCKTDETWSIQVASFRDVSDTSAGPFQTATGGPDPVIEAYLDEVMPGQPLTQAEESLAISNGWQVTSLQPNEEGDPQ